MALHMVGQHSPGIESKFPPAQIIFIGTGGNRPGIRRCVQGVGDPYGHRGRRSATQNAFLECALTQIARQAIEIEPNYFNNNQIDVQICQNKFANHWMQQSVFVFLQIVFDNNSFVYPFDSISCTRTDIYVCVCYCILFLTHTTRIRQIEDVLNVCVCVKKW